MDWDEFFKRTLAASGLASYSQLAPRLGISDGAISHYRMGRRVPQVWVVAEALKVQKHPAPEKAAIEIMKAAALTSEERGFWKRLATATAVIALCAMPLASFPAKAMAYGGGIVGLYIMLIRRWLFRSTDRSNRHTVWNRPGQHSTILA